MKVVSITPKWQIHIPVEIRKKVNLKKPTKVEITVEDGKIVLKPQKSKILSLAGKYKGKKPIKKINLDKIRDYIDYSRW